MRISASEGLNIVRGSERPVPSCLTQIISMRLKCFIKPFSFSSFPSKRKVCLSLRRNPFFQVDLFCLAGCTVGSCRSRLYIPNLWWFSRFKAMTLWGTTIDAYIPHPNTHTHTCSIFCLFSPFPPSHIFLLQHQELLALIDSPLNKAGLLQVFIHTEKHVLIEVNPKVRHAEYTEG